MTRKAGHRSIPLSIIFIFAFLCPLLAAVWIAPRWIAGEARPDHSSEEADELFPNSTLIQLEGASLIVNGRSELNPVRGEDFLILTWFRPRRLPLPGERMYLLDKVDRNGRRKDGYALAIEGSAGLVRPAFYWTDASGKGGWFTFSEVRLEAREWFILAISLYEGTKLGAHVGLISGSGERTLQLAGGHELDAPILVSADSRLRIGAVSGDDFRGRVGPVGIFSVKDLSKNLSQILAAILAHPDRLPLPLQAENALFYSEDGKHDLGRYHLEIDAHSVSAKRKGEH